MIFLTYVNLSRKSQTRPLQMAKSQSFPCLSLFTFSPEDINLLDTLFFLKEVLNIIKQLSAVIINHQIWKDFTKDLLKTLNASFDEIIFNMFNNTDVKKQKPLFS